MVCVCVGVGVVVYVRVLVVERKRRERGNICMMVHYSVKNRDKPILQRNLLICSVH